MDIHSITFTPFDDQRPGTSGLRKPVTRFLEPHYTESFLAAVLTTLGAKDKTIVVGGDGRYHNHEAMQTLVKMAVAYGVKRLIIGEHGLLSTPASSHIIRHYHADYGFIFSASHNPGGKDGDFGIKFNLAEGQPAPESATEAVYQTSLKLSDYQLADIAVPELTQGSYSLGATTLDVISSTADYADLMESLFDFPAIKGYLATHPIVFDAMHAATGPYALEIFAHRLGLDKKYLINTTPLEDFGGGHPDPQPSYAQDLNAALKQYPEAVMGAASDGDGDRNLIRGCERFVNPCDSLAIIADQHANIPCLKTLTGVGRTMPTSRAIDTVCAQKKLKCFETPTGWKFFANLLDANDIQLCGEESFGTGGNHIREKDGIWAVLCWLNLLAVTNSTPDDILKAHWQTYGRHYYNRFDFMALDKATAQSMLDAFGKTIKAQIGHTISGLTITHAGVFNYTDPTNGEKSLNQGWQVLFGRQARIMCRLSGTDTRGATLRLYCEYWQQAGEKEPPLKGTTYTLADLAKGMLNLNQYCGRTQPDNIV